jgi:3-oxoacyl-[acyl-carrier-protein] synthase-1
MAISPLLLSAYTTVNALGRGVEATLTALRQNRSGLRFCDFADASLNTWIGRVEGLEDEPVADRLNAFDCRNHRLAQLGLYQDGFSEAVAVARTRYGAARIGVFIGTSTSGVLETELAYQRCDPGTGNLPDTFSFRHTQDVFAVTEFTRDYLQLTGPASSISTACSSSAKVFATAYRYIQAGLCEAAVVGGVDSLCLTTLYGFNALELTSSQPCRPWDVQRDGLSLAEAASFALLERPKPSDRGIALLGYGESSDAYHMSAAHPEGVGAIFAMHKALASAGVDAAQVDYINLHGTATPANDTAEDKAIVQVFGNATPCSSSKGWTGHTLGAAGATEAVIASLCIEQGLLPGSLNTQQIDHALGADLVLETREQQLDNVLSNSLGFGGTNCSLLFGRWGE